MRSSNRYMETDRTGRQGRRQRAGFSLIELMVVMAILTILMLFIAPTVMRAMARAKVTGCMSNARVLSTTLSTYAADNDWRIFSTPDRPGWLINAASPVTHQKTFPWGWLYFDKYVTDPAVFYCPDARQKRHTLANYPQPWLSDRGPGTQFVRTGYMYVPYERHRVHGFPFGEGRIRLNRINPSYALLMNDLTLGRADRPHASLKAFTVARQDGSVQSIQSEAGFSLSIHTEHHSGWRQFRIARRNVVGE